MGHLDDRFDRKSLYLTLLVLRVRAALFTAKYSSFMSGCALVPFGQSDIPGQ
jgi:hypothetical protein